MNSGKQKEMIKKSELIDALSQKHHLTDSVYGTKIEFESDIWSVLTKHRDNANTTILDFSVFDLDHCNNQNGFNLSFDDTKISLTTKEIAKVIFIESVYEKEPIRHTLTASMSILKSVFAFLSISKESSINKYNLGSFFDFFLTTDVKKGKLKNFYSAPSYKGTYEKLTLPILIRILRLRRIKGVVENMSEKEINSTFNQSTKTILNMTLAEYKSGGSFDFLSLDIGKHYVDHCCNIFEKYAAYGIALQNSINWVIANENYDWSNVNVRRIVSRLLMGSDENEIESDKYVRIPPKLQIGMLKQQLYKIFFSTYKEYTIKISVFQVSSLNKIASLLSLPERYDNQEFIRNLLYTKLFETNLKSPREIWLEYSAALEVSGEKCELTFDEVEAVITNAISELMDIQTLNIEATNWLAIQSLLVSCASTYPIQDRKPISLGLRHLRGIVRSISFSGLTCLVALTGWRSSEYGFPMKALSQEINSDPLDNYYTPLRSFIHWKSFKTSGNTELQREISLNTYLYALCLNELNYGYGQDDDSAILYPLDSVSGLKTKNHEGILRKVNFWWVDFVENYEIFTDLDRIDDLLSLKMRNEEEEQALLSLQCSFKPDHSTTKNLIEIRDKLRSHLPLIKLFFFRDKSKGNVLEVYKNGLLSQQELATLETALPRDVLHSILTGEVELDNLTIYQLTQEALTGVLYPTPHAFRHMWAEAVLRRYAGDVGKFIRANFKHIDERFFASYLRDKELKAIHQVAMRTVINSMVRQQIDSLQDPNRYYAGGFDRFVTKTIHITEVLAKKQFEKRVNENEEVSLDRHQNSISSNVSHIKKLLSSRDYDELMKLQADKISERVISIKPSPFATCVLRRGTNQSAKCAKDGVPQQHDAQPKLCLGCINAEIEDGNYTGIVVYTAGDVAACRNPRLPFSLKKSAIEVVLKAIKRLVELRHNSGDVKYDKFITHLEESLMMAYNCSEVIQ